MTDDWRIVRLSEVATRVSQRNVVGLGRVLTVAAGYGLVDQEAFFTKRVASSDLSTYSVVEPDDLVYNKSSSKGAPFGLVARLVDAEPGVVTPLYFVFRADRRVVSPAYLELACNSGTFFDSLSGLLREGARSHGALNVRLQEFFAAELPLPPPQVQKQVCDLIAITDAAMTAHSEEVAALRRLLVGLREERFDDLWRRGDLVPLSRLAQEVKRPVAVDPGAKYAQVGVRSHGRGVFIKDEVTGQDLGSKKVFYVMPGDLVINIVFAWEGAVAVVPDTLNGFCASHRFPTYRRTDEGPIDFVRQLLLSRRGLHQMSVASPGGAGRNRTLNRKRLADALVPRPSQEEQAHLVKALGALEDSLGAAEAEGERLRVLRRSLVAGLLAGDLIASDVPRSEGAA